MEFYYPEKSGILFSAIDMLMLDEVLPVERAKRLVEGLCELENQHETVNPTTKDQIEKLNLYIQKHDAKK